MNDDFEKYIKEKREQEEKERLEFLNRCGDKVRDNNELIYHSLGLALCERFRLKLSYNGEPPYVVWGIVNYYVDNIDEDWVDWLTKDDALIIRPVSHIKKIFPELAIIKDDEYEIINLANKLYNLDIKTDYDCVDGYGEYFFAYSFDFNSFKPLPVNEIKAIKEERDVLVKYGYNVTQLNEKLTSYGLTEDELEMI